MAPTSSPLTSKIPSPSRARSRPSLSVTVWPPTALKNRSSYTGSPSVTLNRLSLGPDMSRIPSISTPGRYGTPLTPSGQPGRRPRSSLGPTGRIPSSDDAMGQLQEALRSRPPSSMQRLLDEGADTSPSFGLSAPRTPLSRPRTPSSMGAPITPGARRARPSIGLGTSTTTPRKTSLAQSTTTPRRPESRASVLEKFDPVVGEKVRMQSMGMEGTLRFLGPTEFRDGIWAGVELEGGFAGKGKNDGSVEGVSYFECPPACGVFILASRLSPPTAMSRPVSVASRASISGRMTPQDRPRPSTATPGRSRPLLTSSTANRANNDGPPITASLRNTPKKARPSIGVTPVRARQSIGGVTPKARPRQSDEVMPPPPSPGKVRVMAQAAQLEAELRNLRTKNAELVAQLARGSPTPSEPSPDLEALRTDIETAQKEADELRHHLAQTQEDARQATDLAEEAMNQAKRYEDELETVRKKLDQDTQELQALLDKRSETAQELSAKCKSLEEELSEAEGNVEELRAAGQATISLYEQKLSDTETRTYELEDRIRSLEDKLAKSESERLRLETPVTTSTAAEIDNETLQTQLAHLTSKISTLEEHLDEARAHLESEAEGWKGRLEKAKQGEREKGEQVRELQGEIKKQRDEQKSAKGRIGELEVALTEVRTALESARSEIESLRGEANEASSLRTALAKTADNETTIKSLESKVEEMKKDCQRFEAQVATLQAELASAQKSPKPNTLALPSLEPPSPRREYARPRLSTGTTEGDEQKMHGYHHVIRELTAENAALKKQSGDKAVKDLEREVSELESIIESKIYHQDELENEIKRLKQQLAKPTLSRSKSRVSTTTSGTEEWHDAYAGIKDDKDRCELCEGPHELDQCPVFAGNLDAAPSNMGRKRCADCDSTEHDTAECPLADDVF